MKEWWKQFWERMPTGRDRVVRILLWLGVGGILLIALSEWLPQREPSPSADPAVEVSSSQVEAALESRITELLQSVEGVGSCRVMVTLESDTQSVYAADTVLTTGSGDTGTTSESYLTVDTDTGPVGLLLTRIQPTVKGVAVVCDGGEDPAVCQRVLNVVTTAFHISERRVCVVKQQ